MPRGLTTLALGGIVLGAMAPHAHGIDQEWRRACRAAAQGPNAESDADLLKLAERRGDQVGLAFHMATADEGALIQFMQGSGRSFIRADDLPPLPLAHLPSVQYRMPNPFYPDHRHAGWWYNTQPRHLQAGDVFVTHVGTRWVKVASLETTVDADGTTREVWLGPGGVFVGDYGGEMMHWQGIQLNAALDSFYAQTSWHENPRAALALAFEANGVGHWFEAIFHSIGGILDRRVRWRLPIQEHLGGAYRVRPEHRLEFSRLIRTGALEVLPRLIDYAYLSSSVCHGESGTADSFAVVLNGSWGDVYGIGSSAATATGAVRLVAQFDSGPGAPLLRRAK